MDKDKKLLELICENERHIIEDILPFLKCINCYEYMLEPKCCMQCGKQICEICIQKTCKHVATISRHFKMILDTMIFRCKNVEQGCKEKIKYLDLKSHNKKCEYALIDIKSSKIFEKKSNNVYSLNNYLIKSDDESIKANNNFSLKCLKCKINFSEKEKFVSHLSVCYVKIEEDNMNSKEKLLKEFDENLKKNQELNLNNWKHNNLEWIENLKQSNKEFENNYNNLTEKTNGLVITISKYLSNGFLQCDKEYLELLEKEKNLTEKKNELQKNFEIKFKEYNDRHSVLETKIQKKIEDYKKDIIDLDNQKLVLCEELKKKGNFPIIAELSNSFNSDCSKCGNSEEKVKKLFCENCRKKFCENKCVNLCKGSICSQNGIIVCSTGSVACGLCRKFNYCDNCKKKCFYTNCTNKFCPECFKKNEHQARNPNINCKFFTCEVDNRCDCLMTSLFCNKCEKRMCSNCSSKHLNHFPFLENK